MGRRKSLKKEVTSNHGILTRADTVLNRITYNSDPGDAMIENEVILNSLVDKPRRIITREVYCALFKDFQVQELAELDERTSTELSNISSTISHSAECENMVSNNGCEFIYDLKSTSDVLNQVYELESMENSKDNSLHGLGSVDNIVKQAKESESMMDLSDISSLDGLGNADGILNQDKGSESMKDLNDVSLDGLGSVYGILNKTKGLESMMDFNDISFDDSGSVESILNHDKGSESMMDLDDISTYDMESLNSLTVPDTLCSCLDKTDTPPRMEQIEFQPPEKQVIRVSQSSVLSSWVECALDIVMPYIP